MIQIDLTHFFIGIIGLLIGVFITYFAIRSKSLSVICYAYDEDRGDNGVIVDDRYVEIGYKFQMFIGGIPCFEAHKIPIKTFQKKEVSPEKIEAAKKHVISIIQVMVSKHPAIALGLAGQEVIKATS